MNLRRQYRTFQPLLKKIGNETSDAIKALQEEVSKAADIAVQNKIALDKLLASRGGGAGGVCVHCN